MWGSFGLNVAAGIVVLGIGFAGGYAYRWYRSRNKVSLATHIEQSWSDRSIRMSITNHGNAPIIVDSWTVHMPTEELLPWLGELLGGPAETDHKPEPSRRRRLSSALRLARRIWRLLSKRNPIARKNEAARAVAHSILKKLHATHQLLDPGTTQRIGPGESEVRSFPRIGTGPQMPKIASDAQSLTIIPSCHVVGHRGRMWGWPSILLGDGHIPMALQFDDEG